MISISYILDYFRSFRDVIALYSFDFERSIIRFIAISYYRSTKIKREINRSLFLFRGDLLR